MWGILKLGGHVDDQMGVVSKGEGLIKNSHLSASKVSNSVVTF